MGIIVTLRRNADRDPVGENMERDRFHGDWGHLSTCKLVV